MGLRFRKSITLLPGVRLNLSKSGVGVSAGVPGLRASVNSRGQVTGTASIPGTGVSYQKTMKIGGSKSKTDSKSKTKKAAAENAAEKAPRQSESAKAPVSRRKTGSVQIDRNSLRSIHDASDERIDWKKLAEADSSEGSGYDEETWSYLHDAAPGILGGDIDTYLQLISDANPLDDLLDYASGFEFGTDDAHRIEVEFEINDAALTDAGQKLSARDYNDLLQDFICSVSIRVARDMFALLPVNDTVVHTVLGGVTVFSVDFDSATMSKLNFSYIDPSNTATKFRNNMSFDPKNGFAKVNRL